MENDIKAVILAAGKGTRISSKQSDAPKVMREASGRPILSYVLDALSFINNENIILVVGYKKESVMECFKGYQFAVQHEQLGTGHAVMAAQEQLSAHKGAVLICYGDMPAMRRETYENLINTHIKQGNDCTLLTGTSKLPMAFGRIIRGKDGVFERVVEEKDASPEELKIKELNTGVYVFDTQKMLDALKQLKNNNSQGEYYATDIPAIMKSKGGKIGVLMQDLGDDIIGINTSEELAIVEEILSKR
ncbi:MAG: NTP transferase domain-containing protein [Oscillospiraceae bacterium]|nr:NTP transferase domain-containing protein [Oscillospiraceae bacterium]MCL2279068.1 NTP transferase domain-containing protein [Oscillospiraceae bacterium]